MELEVRVFFIKFFLSNLINGFILVYLIHLYTTGSLIGLAPDLENKVWKIGHQTTSLQ